MLATDIEPTTERTPPPPTKLRFGRFVYDFVEQSLSESDREVELPIRSARLLEALIGQPGRTLTKDELIEAVWEGEIVADGSLTEAMSRLRTALADSARDPRYIRTVHRRGYRFIAPIGPTVRTPSKNETERGPLFFPAILSTTVLLFGLLIWLSRSTDPEALTPVASGATPSPTIDLILGLDPLRSLTRLLIDVVPTQQSRLRPRYRIAQLAADGTQPIRHRLPPLPLNGFSVDQTGSRVAFSIQDDERSDAWIYDSSLGTLRQITDSGKASDPVWHPQGDAIAVASLRNGSFDLVVESTDQSVDSQVILEAPHDQFPDSWSRNGRSLIYSQRHPSTGFDLWIVEQHADSRWRSRPLIRRHGDQAFGAISPTGTAVAYVARDRKGSVIQMVDLDGNEIPVRGSRPGDGYPFWSADGRHLHFVRDHVVLTAALDTKSGAWETGKRPAGRAEGLYLAGSGARDGEFIVAMLE